MAAGDSFSEVFRYFLMQVVNGLPYFVVYIGGIILTLILWKRQPRASLLALLGLALMLVTALVGSCLFAWLIHGGPVEAGRGTWLTILGFVRSLLGAAGLCLVLAAVFVGRERPPRSFADRPAAAPPSVEPLPSGPSAHVSADRPPST